MEERWKVSSVDELSVFVTDAKNLSKKYIEDSVRMVDQYLATVKPILARLGAMPERALGGEKATLEAIMRSAQEMKVLFNYEANSISFTYLVRVEETARRLLQKARR